MRRSHGIRRLLVVALVLPSIVAATPVQGPCGLCERGLPCPGMERPPQSATAHACCAGAATDSQAAAGPDQMDCGCGRGPASVLPTVDKASTESHASVIGRTMAVAVDSATPLRHRIELRPPSPPPPPPAFLVGCAFLT